MKGLQYHHLLKVIFLCALTTNVLSIKFNYDIASNQRECLGEYLTENTVAIFNIKSSSKSILCKVYNPSNRVIYQKENKATVKVSITASDSGNYQLCVSNKISTPVRITLEFLSGIAARDYSEIAKESNLKPLELSLKKLEDMIQYLIQETSTIMKQEETDLAINDSLSSKIIIFSMITLLVMVAIGVIETVYIQKYLYNRKII